MRLAIGGALKEEYVERGEEYSLYLRKQLLPSGRGGGENHSFVSEGVDERQIERER